MGIQVFWLVCVLLFTSAQAYSEADSKITYQGYIRYVGQQMWSRNPTRSTSWEWLHLRTNTRFTFAPSVYGVLEVRTRLFQGAYVRENNQLLELLKSPNDAIVVDPSWRTEAGWAAVIRADRLYLDVSKKNTEARIGRQRINWGMSTWWNPNDLFNVYDFLDIDYFERPGTDAIRIKQGWGSEAQAEVAYAPTRKAGQKTGAARITWNRWDYDFALLTGKYHEYWATGVGWAGHLGGAGFRGESTWFHSENLDDLLNLTVEWDYLLSGSWYFSVAGLYASSGYAGKWYDTGPVSFILSPLQPMPSKWTTAFRFQKTVQTLWNIDAVFVYAPECQFIIGYPSLRYDAGKRMDISVAAQVLGLLRSTKDRIQSGSVFASAKWSF